MAIYQHVESMEPLLPSTGRQELADLSQRITLAVGKLSGSVHSPIVRDAISGLVREMNCYYSNLIEGHKTLPKDIESALLKDFSTDQQQKDNQLLATAHIQTETRMLERIREGSVDVYSPEFLCWIHEDFYRRLPESLHIAKTKSGREYRILPGKLRDFMVDVGTHTPPHFDALPAFLDRFQKVYSSKNIFATDQLVAIAAAHHRLAWIHPFGDGNGRVARLHSHALLQFHGLDGGGLWTLSRGLARARHIYYEQLQAADRTRDSDIDGRGNLTERGLFRFCFFFLETVLDQITFMDGLLNLTDLRTRIERYFTYSALHLTKYREELMRIVKALIVDGEFPRERVIELTGKGSTTCAAIIKLGLREGCFTSPSEKGKLQVAFPANILPFYFPNLFVDLPVERER